jgi:exodeoxyribonuclease VII large subunit
VIHQFYQRFEEIRRKLKRVILHRIDEYKNSISAVEAKLSALSPFNILRRGYSIAFKLPENTIIRDATAVSRDTLIRVRLHRGELLAKVEQVKREN